MQHISDDMDDLVRNAAENYPLKISGADWESIAGRLSGEDEGNKEVAPVVALPVYSRYKVYRYAALLLLLPLAYLITKYAGRSGGGVKTEQVGAASQGDATKKGDEAKNGVIVSPVATDSARIGVKQNFNNNSITAQSSASVKNKTAFSIKTRGSGITDKTGEGATNPGASKNAGISQQLAAGKKNDKQNGVSDNRLSASSSNISSANSHLKDSDEEGGYGKPAPVATVSATTKPPAAPVSHKDSITHPSKTKRFYIGAYIAPEYTTVKYQPGSKIGFNYGGLFGYKLNKYLSVEAGIGAGKKYYTSSGKYFNADVAWFRNLGTVLSLSGYSSLTEFPVNLKYSFKPGKEGNFFVSAGFISYVVHHENYIYVVDKNNSVYTVSNTPVMATTDFFSNMSISGGYESKLGSLCDFRVEPYYRIPLRGIGIGSLPITSMGLNIGVIKKIK